ncbi:MAG TPA: tetratricopeptide repeat protein, partial [Pirellulaceae bacterium]|nr:tetratricopeptide repeat protein [Pirellulaceae bacterium]
MKTVRKSSRHAQRSPETPATPAGASAESKQPAATTIVRRKLNWRFLIVSGLIATALSGVLWGVHRWQVSRLADAILARARQQEQDEQWSQAADSLHRFLQIRPEHAEARVRLAECYDRALQSPYQRSRAIELYYRAIGSAPDDLDLRRRLGQLLLDQRQFTAAGEQAEALLGSDTTDPAALRIAAISLHARNMQRKRPLDKATRALLGRAIAANPRDVWLVSLAAQALHDEGARLHRDEDQTAAASLMDALLVAAPEDPLAWLARYHFRKRINSIGAADDLTHAGKLSPNSPAILLATAEFALQQRQWQTAIDACRTISKQGQPTAVVFRIWGDALVGSGQTTDGVEQWRKGLATQPAFPIDLQLRLATAYISDAQLGDAGELLAALDTDTARPLHGQSNADWSRLRGTVQMLRARWHAQRGEWSLATPLLRGIAHSPVVDKQGRDDLQRHVDAWLLLSDRESKLERFDLAAEHLERAIALLPTNAKLRLAAAQVLVQGGRLNEALKHAEVAALREPGQD